MAYRIAIIFSPQIHRFSQRNHRKIFAIVGRLTNNLKLKRFTDFHRETTEKSVNLWRNFCLLIFAFLSI